MDDPRPDPDVLLARVKAEEAKQARGKLKIFFGAAPGVGKTYTMLEAGRKVAKEGVNVLIGYVEPHVRPETQALVLGLDLLARREIPYRGTTLLEFDLEAALAARPTLILVDELAHTNTPGCTHSKRWQDIEKLLDAGIDVYTTMNVQHLESLNDIVAQITTVRVRETVPDAVFEQADEVELVDLPPDDLIDRLHEGKVYVPQQAQRAIEHFFRKGNLIALRELALRMMAQRVGAQVQDWRERHAEERRWPTGERLMVCVGPSPFSARLIRAARRMAVGLQAQWYAVHVENPARPPLGDEDRQRLAMNMHLGEQLGANIVTLTGPDFADEIFRFARDKNISRVVVGKPQAPPWRMWLRRSYVHELIQRSGDVDVYVISGEEETNLPRVRHPHPQPTAVWNYVWSAAIVLACTGLGFLMHNRFAEPNIVMVYMAAIVGISLRFGRGPSIFASVLSVAGFDFCFVPPQWTFAVSDTQYLFTFAVMLVTGLVISTLTVRVKQQAEAARNRERRTGALYSLSRELAALPTREAIAQAACRQLAAATDSRVTILLPIDGRLMPLDGAIGFEPDDHGRGVAQWVYEHHEPAGLGTDTLPGADALYLPLNVAGGTFGVLGIMPERVERVIQPEQFRLLEAFASQIALAIERADLAREAEQIRLQMETEQLRNSLLSAISHDLRTPLATITGASSTLMDLNSGANDGVRELAEAIFDESERLNRLVGNLLDMTRLEAGAIRVRKELQPLEEVVGVVLERLGRQLREHPVATRLPAELPPVPIDGLLIQQVLTNLLENAAKYSPLGTPIELSASADAHTLTVEVSDGGQGIKPGDEERIFDKFFRSAASVSGAGLGLPICRGIIELHGGRIWAENRPDGGAVFRFTLPIPPSVVQTTNQHTLATASHSGP